MFDAALILATTTLLLALLGLSAVRFGWDSRDGFADQAHRAPQR